MELLVRVKMGWLGFGGLMRTTRCREMVGSGGGKFPSSRYAVLSGIRVALSRIMHEVDSVAACPYLSDLTFHVTASFCRGKHCQIRHPHNFGFTL